MGAKSGIAEEALAAGVFQHYGRTPNLSLVVHFGI